MPRGEKTGTEEKAVKTEIAAEQPKPEKKETVVVQFAGREFDVEAVKTAVKADYKGKVKGKINILDIYIKPEDGAAYYVVNNIHGKVEL